MKSPCDILGSTGKPPVFVDEFEWNPCEVIIFDGPPIAARDIDLLIGWTELLIYS